MSSADTDHAIANDLAPYPHRAGIGRALCTLAGIGMLFSPIGLIFQHHTGDERQDTGTCAYYAEHMPEIDPATINCASWER